MRVMGITTMILPISTDTIRNDRASTAAVKGRILFAVVKTSLNT
jgi:hypothetical protein